MKEEITLDRESSIIVFCYIDYCKNIKPTFTTLEIQTNGGNITMNKSCDISNLGKGYFHDKSITNTIGLNDMRKCTE